MEQTKTTEMRTLTTVVADMRDPTLSSLCDVSFHLLNHPSLSSPHTKEFHLEQTEYKTREAFNHLLTFVLLARLLATVGSIMILFPKSAC